MSQSGAITTEQGEPSVGPLWVTALLTVLLLVVAMGGSYLMFNTTVSMELNEKEKNPIPLAVLKLRTYESEALNTLKWINKSRGEVQIPLSLAQDLVVKAYAK